MLSGHKGLNGFMDWFTTTEEPQPTALAYDRAAVIAKQNELHGVLPPFVVLDFVTGVAEETARGFQRECWQLADRLKASGVLDSLFAGYVTWFANHGALLYPSRDQVKDDPEALDALNAALVRFGFADLKHRILTAQQLTARAQAEELEKATAFWDHAYTAVSWLSGAAAVESCLNSVRQIGESAQAIRADLDAAREYATPDEYAALLALASPANDQLARMNRFVAGGEEATGGALGSPVVLLVVAAGVAAVVLAAIYAYIETVRNSVNTEANRILARRQEELEDSRRREAEAIEANPMLAPEEKAEALRALEEGYRSDLARLPAPRGAAASGGLGGFLGIAALVAAAIFVVPMLLKGRK